MEKFFNQVVKIVSEETGINDNDLIHSKKEEFFHLVNELSTNKKRTSNQ